jgi:hypothetical protein
MLKQEHKNGVSYFFRMRKDIAIDEKKLNVKIKNCIKKILMNEVGVKSTDVFKFDFHYVKNDFLVDKVHLKISVDYSHKPPLKN